MNTNKLPELLVKTIKSTLVQNEKALNEQAFNKSTTEQIVRHKRTKAVYSMIFDHGMGEYKFTPLTNSARGVFYKPTNQDYELAGTGVKEKTYTRCAV